MLLHQPALDDHDLRSVQTCVYGGSPMPLSIIEEAIARLPTWGFHQIYGQTESSGYVTCLSWADHRAALEGHRAVLRSAGRPVPGMDAKIFASDGGEAAANVVGEIAVQGDSVMMRYFDSPDETARAFDAGWFRTGDVGYFDERGFLFIADRVKDMIITGGENVYSVDVERALYAHPAARECAVVGIPDPLWGEAIHAIVVLEADQSITKDELVAHCRALIAGYKVPRSIDLVPGPLPLTPVGKIRKNVLRDPFWVGHEPKI